MSLTRRSIALLAAYVVAFQTLLLPLGLISVALAGAHCAPDNPAQHQNDGCPCAAGCGTQCFPSVINQPPQAPIARVAHVVPQTLPVPTAQTVRPSLRGPQVARPPPVCGHI